MTDLTIERITELATDAFMDLAVPETTQLARQLLATMQENADLKHDVERAQDVNTELLQDRDRLREALAETILNVEGLLESGERALKRAKQHQHEVTDVG